MKQKINGRSICLTVFLALLLLIVIASLWALFVSGPARAYEVRLAQEEAAITSQHDAVGNLHRHVFRYVTYSGEDNQNYYWFNTEGQVITTRAKGTRDDDAARAAAEQLGLSAESVTLGYGYENPVYVLESGNTTPLLDSDTLEQVDEREVSADE